MFPGWSNTGRCSVTLYVGEGPRRSRARSTLHWISATPWTTHNLTGPLWCWFPSGWACARPRPLWVSPATSPVRLGVSPAATPTPTGVFNQRFEALFPRAGALGCAVCFDPPVCPVSLCSNVGLQGLLVVGLPALFVPHSASLGPTTATGVLSAPVPSPPLLPVWVNVYFLFPWCRTSLLFVFLSVLVVRLSVLVVRGGAVCLPTPPSWFFLLFF